MAVAAYSPISSGQTHKCQTRDGRTTYQEQPCEGDAKASVVKRPGTAAAGDGGTGGSGKRKPEEDRALENLITIASVAKDCKEILGHYVSIDEMRSGCRGGGTGMTLSKNNHPDSDPAYTYRFSTRTDGFDLSATPRQPGLTGYFTDGKTIFENSSGVATNQSRRLAPLPF